MERSHSIFMEKILNVWLLIAGMFVLLCLTGSVQGICGNASKNESKSCMTNSQFARISGEIQVMDTSESENLKKIALTFDDGPHPVYTPLLLDGLAKRKVKATFFITGENAENYPDLVKRMQEEGHLIGNHTYSHIQLTQDNREQFKAELMKTNTIIEEITGQGVTYVRPPYGSWDKTFEKELNMIPVLWSIDPLDWCCDDAACVVRKVESAAEENAIILLHDSYPSTVTAALQIVDDLQKQGYVFVTVEEILFD